jgi:predicted metal-binding membrane protein
MTTSVPSSTNGTSTRRGWVARGPQSPLEQGQAALLLALLILTAGAWALTIYQARTMDMPMGVVPRVTAEPPTMPAADGMDGMAMDEASSMAATGMAGAGWSVAGFGTFIVAWVVMMAAMMFPAAAPMLLLFRIVTTQRHAGTAAFVPTWVFAAGYLLVWGAVGVLTWALIQVLSDMASRLGIDERATWAPMVLGAVLIGAGLYQLTPLKQVCLDHCRSPFAFVMQHWREGASGALRMGVVHGLYCLGCCWALCAVLVAAGVMSLAWMLLLTLIIFAEKVLPGGQRTSQVVGIAFLVLGLGVLAGVVDVPWIA